jgi:hypothetical protein
MEKLEDLTVDELIKALIKTHGEVDKKLIDIVCFCTDELPKYTEDLHE